MTSGLVALNNNWLDNNVAVGMNVTSDSVTATSWTVADSSANFCVNWPPYYGSWYHVATTPRPIRLTLAEVQRLRAAAKRDAKLKAILAKFTDQIEVAVDFDEG